VGGRGKAKVPVPETASATQVFRCSLRPVTGQVFRPSAKRPHQSSAAIPSEGQGSSTARPRGGLCRYSWRWPDSPSQGGDTGSNPVGTTRRIAASGVPSPPRSRCRQGLRTTATAQAMRPWQAAQPVPRPAFVRSGPHHVTGREENPGRRRCPGGRHAGGGY